MPAPVIRSCRSPFDLLAAIVLVGCTQVTGLPIDPVGSRSDAAATDFGGLRRGDSVPHDDIASPPDRDDHVEVLDGAEVSGPPADARRDVAPSPALDATSPPDSLGGSGADGRTPQSGPLFGAPVTISIPDGLGPGGRNATAIGIGDVTGDGRADVIVGTYHPAIVVYPQTADGTLGPPVKYPISSGSVSPPGLLDVGDLDGDGRLDVVFPRDDGIGLLRGRAVGDFEPEQVLPPPPVGSGYDLEIADLDGDGRKDLVVMPYDSTGVEVRLQDSAGVLVSIGFFRCPGDSYSTMATGDTDGDGLTDIVLGIYGGPLCLLRQRAGGGFEDGVAFPVNGQVSGVAVGNFGAVAGKPAVAFALYGNRPDSQLGFFTPSSTGVTTTPTLLGARDLPEGIAAIDVDGDGLLDIVVLHVAFELVGAFRALPTGGLAPEELYPFSWINHGADRLAVGDINGDGRPDVVSADFDLSILYHL